MGEFNLQESFDELRARVWKCRNALGENRIVDADRMLASLYEQLTATYQALAEPPNKLEEVGDAG